MIVIFSIIFIAVTIVITIDNCNMIMQSLCIVTISTISSTSLAIFVKM